MFVVDDILTAPFRAILWLFREIVQAATAEQQAEGDRIKDELRALYMRLETGQISEAEFDAEEGPLLDRLDQLEAAATEGAAVKEDAGEDSDEDDEDDGEEEEEDDGGEEDAGEEEDDSDDAGEEEEG